MRANLELPDAFHDELREGTGSTRLERDGDALLAVVHDVLFDFTFDASDVSTVTLCVQPQVMVSVRLKPLRSLDRLRASVKAGDGFGSPAGLLAQLLRDQAGVLADILRQATGRVDAIEDKVLTNRISVSRTELGALRLHGRGRIPRPQEISGIARSHIPAEAIESSLGEYLLASRACSVYVRDPPATTLWLVEVYRVTCCRLATQRRRA